ncbi:MAG: Rrf2 family transcriptional regulator [Oscillospiraceae bacterium]|nr:Rrf2 family transcriptional regulator [Oscillospiraceae bacterium]
MKISTRVEYGLIALTDIAMNCTDGCSVSSSEISERQNISQKYLEQIIIALRQGGFVKGMKGSRGGYVLSRPADMICLSDILNALDNNILADVSEDIGTQSGGLRCSVNVCLWDKINDFMRSFTGQMTLADLINESTAYADSMKDSVYYG